VDLPKGFGKDPAAVAITTTPGGDDIVVVDGLGRQIVELDAAELRVTRTEHFRGLAPSHFPVMATATDDRVFVARDNKVVALNRSTFGSAAEWTTKGAVQAVHLGTAGLVLVAEHNRVTAIDPKGNGRGWTVKVNVGGAIHSVADTLAYTSKGSVQCAC
jgi:DNA-binding beta-propeller fold protein YncE